MGRGRAKAKQTKVARELKYSSPTTDFESLQRELSGREEPAGLSGRDDPVGRPEPSDDDHDYEYEKWQ